MKKIALILSIILFSCATAVIAQQPPEGKVYTAGWHKIGEVTVDFKVDRDAIQVWGTDKFKAIELKVTDAHIRVEDFDVHYEINNIQEDIKEDISLKTDFKPGDRSRVIYLKYPCLNLQKIVFVYHTVANWRHEKAHVELYGYK